MERKHLSFLYSDEYEHPFDRHALNRLEKTRGLHMVSEKILKAGFEKYLIIRHTADNIQVTKDTIPEVYALLEEACQVLDMEQVPELYIYLEDKIKSFTTGRDRQLIAISSGSIDLLSEDELYFLIARELGHIRSNHVLYRMMADSVQTLSKIAGDISMGLSNWVSYPLQIALMHWYRMSEFTADRAGLLACQCLDTCLKAFIKIAGLPQVYHDRVSVADYRKQVQAFHDFQESNFDRLIQFAANVEYDQPFLAIRADQLITWHDVGAYQQILNRIPLLKEGNHTDCESINCPQPFDEYDNFCTECGKRLRGGTAALPSAPPPPPQVIRAPNSK
ncbi:MAG: M48 family metallopeptidase [Bacteroidota bacterium]